MTRSEALPRARQIAAAVCDIEGCGDSFCNFMREGAYDDNREVQIALAALMTRVVAAPANDPIRGALTGDEFREYLNEFTPDSAVSA